MSASQTVSTAPGAVFYVSPKEWTVLSIREWLRYLGIPFRSVARKAELLAALRGCEMAMTFGTRVAVVDFITQYGHRSPPPRRLPTAPNRPPKTQDRHMHKPTATILMI